MDLSGLEVSGSQWRVLSRRGLVLRGASVSGSSLIEAASGIDLFDLSKVQKLKVEVRKAGLKDVFGMFRNLRELEMTVADGIMSCDELLVLSEGIGNLSMLRKLHLQVGRLVFAPGCSEVRQLKTTEVHVIKTEGCR